jgi:hypothetical protein
MASADGQRFLMNTVPEDASASPNTVILLNWLEELKQLVPAK